MAKKEKRRTQMTKRLLKTALIELMQEKPFSKITIKELCEKADLNRTTFYLHYSDQQGVLDDIEEEILEKTAEYMKNQFTRETNVEVIETFLFYLKDQGFLARTLLTDPNYIRFQQTYLQYIWDSIKDQLPDYGTPERTRYIKVFLMNGSMQIIREWIESDFDLTPKEIAQLTDELCFSIKGV